MRLQSAALANSAYAIALDGNGATLDLIEAMQSQRCPPPGGVLICGPIRGRAEVAITKR
ncbi:hypothetical protein MES5069_200160 [Mesorhizobium escarrei]|uniref:Uncharacterized protein n=1 Tax=Mesorhizobium escarrei TaxID=666018 RepID=A0ABM9DQ25_9HYPH|nr:hypothetical protein MES5069_200160 [Mesorhizobium escarrei]